MSSTKDTENIEGKTKLLPQMDRESEITLLEWLLDVKLPESYRKFLLEKGNDIINGLPILGLPISRSLFMSVLGATKLLRGVRRSNSLVAIRLLDTRALCLDLENGSEDDAPLVEVNLKEQNSDPVRVHNSFRLYMEEGEKTKRYIREAFRRAEEIRERELCKERDDKKSSEWAEYDHKFGKNFPKAEDWQIHRSCVHDEVVGITAIRYSPEKNGLLVDVFLTTDHQNYEEGHGVRNLVLLILSEAYSSGGSLEINFTKNVYAGKVPDEIIRLAMEYDIHLKYSKRGKISHEEAVKLYGKSLASKLKLKKPTLSL